MIGPRQLVLSIIHAILLSSVGSVRRFGSSVACVETSPISLALKEGKWETSASKLLVWSR